MQLIVLFGGEEEQGVLDDLIQEATNRGQQFPFKYSRKETEFALQTFEGPYGRVGGNAEEVEFLACECLDADGDLLETPHDPCIRKSAIIQKLIYTTEEAERKRKEKESEDGAIIKELDKVHAWYETKMGKKRLAAALTRLKKYDKRILQDSKDGLKKAVEKHVKQLK